METTQHANETQFQHSHQLTKAEEARLLQDERWQLVQRILTSAGLQRADQLRKILLYITQRAILRPEEGIREYDIARNVLGRRSDFESGSDNIVRVQISHLRRKLEQYYAVEGADEPIVLTVPRGGYAASFAYVPLRSAAAVAPIGPSPTSEPAFVPPQPPVADTPATEASPKTAWSLRERVLAGALCLALLLLAGVSLRYRFVRSAGAAGTGPENPFLAPLLNNGKTTSVILPDVSLMTVQTLLGQDVSVGDYIAHFPQQQLQGVDDSELRRALAYITSRRVTSFGEATVALSLVERLSRPGSPARFRYARDLHVQDMGENNIVILGSRRANPWTSLFTDRANFRYVQDPTDRSFVFVNAHPNTNEQPRYVPDYTQTDRQVNYVDIVLVPNLTNTGYVLLLNGTDVQATEAAARFIVGGTWPEQLRPLRAAKDLKYYEVFLRGTHISGEAEDNFEVVALRLSDS